MAQFVKGQSGNPNGRPKREPCLTRALAQKISELDDKHRMRLEEIAATGNHKDATAAIKLLWSYAHGTPVQRVADADGEPLSGAIVFLPRQVSEDDGAVESESGSAD